MKLNIKKGMLGLGTVAAVAAPIAAVVSCGTTANSINWKDTDKFGGVEGSDFLQQIKNLGQGKKTAVTVAQQQLMQTQYNIEQQKSIVIQTKDIEYNIWTKTIQQTKLVADQTKAQTAYDGVKDDDAIDQSVKDSKKTALDSANEAVTNIKDDLDDLQENLTAIKADDFLSTDYKASDFPKVLESLEKIRTEKKKTVDEAYSNFVKQYTTRDEGEYEWPEELKSAYGNASTSTDAVNYLVTQEISSKAFTAYKFAINKSFTLEQALYSEFVANNAYTFLNKDSYVFTKNIQTDVTLIRKTITDAVTAATSPADKIKAATDTITEIVNGDKLKGKIEASTITTSISFLGSTSVDPSLPGTGNDIYTTIGATNVQHALLPIKQGKTKDDVWTIDDKYDIAKIFRLFNRGGTDAVNGFDLLTGSVFQESTKPDGVAKDKEQEEFDKLTTTILTQISGNSAGTQKIQGKLGMQSILDYVKTMAAGFGLGALELFDGTTTADQSLSLSDLGAKLQEILITAYNKKFVDDLPVDPTGKVVQIPVADMAKYNKNIAELFTDEKADLATKIGAAVRDWYNKLPASHKLLFQDGTSGNYFSISSFGIHIMKENAADDGDKIAEAFKADLKKMADEGTASSTGIVNLLNTKFDTTHVMDALLKSTTKYDEDGKVSTSGKTIKETLQDKLDEYNKGKELSLQVSMDDVDTAITTVQDSAAFTKLQDSLGDKLEKWLITQFDADLRDKTIKPEDIYALAKKAAGV